MNVNPAETGGDRAERADVDQADGAEMIPVELLFCPTGDDPEGQWPSIFIDMSRDQVREIMANREGADGIRF